MKPWRVVAGPEWCHVIPPDAEAPIRVPSTQVSWVGGFATIHVPADIDVNVDPDRVAVHRHYPEPRASAVAEAVDGLPSELVSALMAEESSRYGLDVSMGLIAMRAVGRALGGERPDGLGGVDGSLP